MDDLISRQAAIDALGRGNEWDMMGLTVIDKDDAIRQIKSLPAAQPERKKGKWVKYEFGDHTWHKCSFCGCADKYKDEVQRVDGTTGVLTSIRNFCPNCGADMRGEE